MNRVGILLINLVTVNAKISYNTNTLSSERGSILPTALEVGLVLRFLMCIFIIWSIRYVKFVSPTE